MIDQKQPENEECFKYLCILITKDARCRREMKSRIAMEKTAFKKKNLFISKWDLNLRKKAVKYYGAYHFCGAANWTHRKVDKKFRQNFEM